MREAYKAGVAPALLEKVGAFGFKLPDASEENSNWLRTLGGVGLGGGAALLGRGFLQGAMKGRSAKSKLMWGSLGTLGALGLGGWVGQRALKND